MPEGGFPHLMYCFQTTDKKRGPVENMMVTYGTNQFLWYLCSIEIALVKKGWFGTEPITSLEIPVGMVFRTKAGTVNRGSKFLAQPSSKSM